jgi:hypothetical protein
MSMAGVFLLIANFVELELQAARVRCGDCLNKGLRIGVELLHAKPVA